MVGSCRFVANTHLHIIEKATSHSWSSGTSTPVGLSHQWDRIGVLRTVVVDAVAGYSLIYCD